MTTTRITSAPLTGNVASEPVPALTQNRPLWESEGLDRAPRPPALSGPRPVIGACHRCGAVTRVAWVPNFQAGGVERVCDACGAESARAALASLRRWRERAIAARHMLEHDA